MGEDISDSRPGLLDIVRESQIEYREKADVDGPENPPLAPTSKFADVCYKIMGISATLFVVSCFGIGIYLTWKWALDR